MDKEWELSFSAWAQGPGKTEQEKCEHAEQAVKNAIRAHDGLKGWDITVGAHGSYRVRTNVKQESDVDIYIRLNQPDFFAQYPAGKTREDFGNRVGALDYNDFKNRIETALKRYLGDKAVSRGKKAFDVHENTYRIDADVIAVLPHRWYTENRNADGSNHYTDGISFRTDDGVIVRSWPEQTYKNGVAKNTATAKRYKSTIRILKNLRNYMQEHKVSEATAIPSYLIECLVWNVTNDHFGNDAYWEDIYRTLSYLIGKTADSEACKEWREVNEVRYLWDHTQLWSLPQAHRFLKAAWRFLEFQ